RVAATRAAYFEFARKVRSPGPALSSEFTRAISIAPSPSRVHRGAQPDPPASRRREYTPRARSRFVAGDALDEPAQPLEPERGGDLVESLAARLGVRQIENRADFRELGRRFERPLRARESLLRTLHRVVVGDRSKGEIPGDD